jgi:indoleacetamide hydrolase
VSQDNQASRRKFLSTAGALVGAPLIPGASKGFAQAQNSLTRLSAVEAVTAMRNGEIKAEEYAKALLDRCDALSEINAFVSRDRDKVLESARKADRARSAGRTLGVMHGLPVPIKDSINTKDLPTTLGTPALRNFRPRHDAPVARALLDAGAILLGKTNLHELSFGWTSNNMAFGPVRNPYDLNRIPGGSSGGTAVAVATGMAPAGLAEDTCGSIRVPAALCGIKGFRPTTFRWSVEGVMPLTSIFDTVGPHARSVADLALFDSVVTGDKKPLEPPSLRGIRLGVVRDHYYADLDPEVEKISAEALSRLAEAGAQLVESEVPGLTDLWQIATFPIIHHETRPAITEYLRQYETRVTWDQLLADASDDIKRDFGWFVVEGGQYRAPKAAYEEARNVHRPMLQNAFRRYFREHGIDAIVFPTLMTPAPPIGQDMELEIRGKNIPFYVAMSRNIAPGSTVGIPGLVLPAGLTASGLPVALEFDAPVGKDHELLALGLALERVLGDIPGPPV